MAENEVIAVETEETAAAETSTALTVPELVEVHDEPEKPDKKQQKKEKKEKKRRYGEVMTTGAFFRTFLLLLIPGLNVILIIFWAIGAAKNRNKVNLSRGLMAFFIIEVLLALILFGAAYIFADQKEAEILGWLDARTNGVISYMDIETYKDLPKLLETSKYLKDKNPPKPVVVVDDKEDEEEAKPETEPVIPPVCYAYNPEGIESVEQFKELFDAHFKAPEEEEEDKDTEKSKDAKSDDKDDKKSDDKKADDKKADDKKADDKKDVKGKDKETEKTEESGPDLTTLDGVLQNANVDLKNFDRIYIILDNEETNCVIIFDTNGSFETVASFPSITTGSDYIIVGGAKNG